MRALQTSLILLLALAGCSGLKTYPTTAGGNLAVHSEMDSGVSATLHIHRVDEQCRTEYRGTVQLDRPTVALDLPPGQRAYLVVTFDTSSFFAGSRSTSVATLLDPRPGRRYELAARYHERIYDAALWESDPATGQRRPLPRRDLQACRARS